MERRDRQVFHGLRVSTVRTREHLAEVLTQGVLRMTAPDCAVFARVRLLLLPTGSDDAAQLHGAVLELLEAILTRLGLSGALRRVRPAATRPLGVSGVQ